MIDKVDIGRRYQENLVFDIPVQHKILVLEFFFGTIFLRCIIFKRLPEVHRARQKITSICYQVKQPRLVKPKTKNAYCVCTTGEAGDTGQKPRSVN